MYESSLSLDLSIINDVNVTSTTALKWSPNDTLVMESSMSIIAEMDCRVVILYPFHSLLAFLWEVSRQDHGRTCTTFPTYISIHGRVTSRFHCCPQNEYFPRYLSTFTRRIDHPIPSP